MSIAAPGLAGGGAPPARRTTAHDHKQLAEDRWGIDWEQLPDGRPAKADVAGALAAHRGASRHAGSIVLSTAVGDVIRHCEDRHQARIEHYGTDPVMQ